MKYQILKDAECDIVLIEESVIDYRLNKKLKIFLNEINEKYNKIKFDLSKVTYMNSVAIGNFVELRKTFFSKKGELFFINLNIKILEIVNMLGLNEIFNIQ